MGPVEKDDGVKMGHRRVHGGYSRIGDQKLPRPRECGTCCLKTEEEKKNIQRSHFSQRVVVYKIENSVESVGDGGT